MKIGIITQPLSYNYGGILQNYALQTVLKRMGHEPYTFDVGKFTWFDWLVVTLKVVIHYIFGHKGYDFPKNPIERKHSEAQLRRFVNNHITLLSPRTKRISKRQVENKKFDVLIVGSDQVWRPKYNRFLSDCFFGFLSEKSNLKRIAYAASFGTDDWEYSNAQTKECSKLAQKFDAISVREDSGVQLCKDYLDVSATHVLDPTLLLSFEDYIKLCDNIPVRKPFLFAYILDQNDKKLSQIKSFSDRLHLPYRIVSAGPDVKSDEFIELWLSYFRDAAYVITDSFHGTVFSILFNKNFCVLDNNKRGQSRFYSLLSSFGLLDRLYNKNSCVIEHFIDWNEVNRKLKIKRDYSTHWLKRNLL